jgi:hypothetical protein
VSTPAFDLSLLIADPRWFPEIPPLGLSRPPRCACYGVLLSSTAIISRQPDVGPQLRPRRHSWSGPTGERRPESDV